MEEIIDQIKEKYGEEAAAKLVAALKSSGGMSQPLNVNIDVQTVFVVLATCSLLVGKDPADIDTNEIAGTAFSLANRLFNPNGELDK